MKHSLILVLLLSIFISSSCYSQNNKKRKKIELFGLIIDSLNSPISNADIYVDGRKIMATSNAEGRFRLKLKPKVKSVAVFKLMNGYAKLEYQGEKEVIFVLPVDNSVQQDALNMAEKPSIELVDVGYKKTQKSNLTTGVGVIKKGVFEKAFQYYTIYDMIRGEVSGVSVIGTSIRIRFKSTVNGNSAPLLIVDGIPVESISDISPTTVESISILKGPSTAIYGSRGANGVVLIRLK